MQNINLESRVYFKKKIHSFIKIHFTLNSFSPALCGI